MLIYTFMLRQLKKERKRKSSYADRISFELRS